MQTPNLNQTYEGYKDTPVWMVWGEKEERPRPVNVKLKDFFLSFGVGLEWKEIEGVAHKYMGEYQEQSMDWFNTKVKEYSF